jgi:hypothetical protein
MNKRDLLKAAVAAPWLPGVLAAAMAGEAQGATEAKTTGRRWPPGSSSAVTWAAG